MSNFTKAITFLKSNPESRFLVITDENGTKIGIEKTYLQHIPNDDLEAYLKLHLGHKEDVMVWIEAREQSGATDKKRGSFPVRINKNTQAAEQTNMSTTPVSATPQPDFNFLAGAAQNNGMLGMTIPAVMEMQRKADRLDDAKEKLADLRKEYEAVKHERNLLDIETRELKSKVATAEAQKDLAVQLAKTENRSFFESEAFGELMKKAPEMLGNIVALKSGAVPQMESLGAASNLSETKVGFVEYMDENLSDEQVNYLGSICHFLNNQAFKDELATLIRKYNGSK